MLTNFLIAVCILSIVYYKPSQCQTFSSVYNSFHLDKKNFDINQAINTSNEMVKILVMKTIYVCVQWKTKCPFRINNSSIRAIMQLSHTVFAVPKLLPKKAPIKRVDVSRSLSTVGQLMSPLMSSSIYKYESC